jgi:pimeloyl-ACP methyl ester carboxylesterase
VSRGSGWQDMPHRAATTVVRRWDTAWPVQRRELETISAHPEGWADLPRAERRPPLLFVPGAGGAAWNYAEHWLGAAVRRGYPAHAMSLRGHGGSAGRQHLHRAVLRDYVADVLQATAALPQPPVLIGHGMGAAVVQQVIQRYPAAAAVLVAPAPMSGTGLVWAQLRRSPARSVRAALTRRLPIEPELFFCGLDAATGAAYLRRFGSEAPLVLLQLARQPAIGPVFGPVAVVGCREDAVVGPEEVRHVADVFGARPIWLPGAGHLVMLDSSHSVGLDIVLDWVDEHLPVDRPATVAVP